MGELWLVRHGQTEWSRDGRHTSDTDLPLLPEGEERARSLAPRLAGTGFGLVLTSPLQRARRTAELAGFGGAEVDPDLVEWRYGEYEGITSAEVHRSDPGWTIWDGVTPDGESAVQVTERLDRVVARVLAETEPTLAFAHGHSLRALTARWLDQPVVEGRRLVLGTGTVCRLGFEHDFRAIVTWNS